MTMRHQKDKDDLEKNMTVKLDRSVNYYDCFFSTKYLLIASRELEVFAMFIWTDIKYFCQEYVWENVFSFTSFPECLGRHRLHL